MPDLKLAKLPDRTLVKITIAVSAPLNQTLQQYAETYQARYGIAETITELIPYMLQAFIEGDAEFKKAKRGQSSQK